MLKASPDDETLPSRQIHDLIRVEQPPCHLTAMVCLALEMRLLAPSLKWISAHHDLASGALRLQFGMALL